MYMRVRRVCELKAPFELCVENGNDWTHFTHLHRKSHAQFRLLAKSGARELFLYQARALSWLPFLRTYVVFREYLPKQNSYRQLYLNVRNGSMSYLDGTNEKKGDLAVLTGDFTFWAPDWMRPFARVLFWVFRRRMRVVMEEDNVLIRERVRLGAIEAPAACIEPNPAAFDLFEDFLRRGVPKADVTFEDRAYADLTA